MQCCTSHHVATILHAVIRRIQFVWLHIICICFSAATPSQLGHQPELHSLWSIPSNHWIGRQACPETAALSSPFLPLHFYSGSRAVRFAGSARLCCPRCSALPGLAEGASARSTLHPLLHSAATHAPPETSKSPCTPIIGPAREACALLESILP